jgi:hypothetical protein
MQRFQPAIVKIIKEFRNEWRIKNNGGSSLIQKDSGQPLLRYMENQKNLTSIMPAKFGEAVKAVMTLAEEVVT